MHVSQIFRNLGRGVRCGRGPARPGPSLGKFNYFEQFCSTFAIIFNNSQVSPDTWKWRVTRIRVSRASWAFILCDNIRDSYARYPIRRAQIQTGPFFPEPSQIGNRAETFRNVPLIKSDLNYEDLLRFLNNFFLVLVWAIFSTAAKLFYEFPLRGPLLVEPNHLIVISDRSPGKFNLVGTIWHLKTTNASYSVAWKSGVLILYNNIRNFRRAQIETGQIFPEPSQSVNAAEPCQNRNVSKSDLDLFQLVSGF